MSETTTTCPCCGHTSAGDPEAVLATITRCTVCDARIVYGSPAPRVVVEPGSFAGGQPAIVVRVQDPLTKADLTRLELDPNHGFLLAQAIISMVRP